MPKHKLGLKIEPMSHQTETTSIPPAPPTIKVRIESGTADKREYLFTQPFRCGRDKSCEVRLTDTAVSRFHSEFWFSDGRWWILDLQSANGSYLDGRRVERAPIATLARVQLGDEGPVLLLTVENVSMVESVSMAASVSTVEAAKEDEKNQTTPSSLEQYQEHYFKDTGEGNVGEHTMMIRQAFKKVQKRQRGRFAAVIAVLSCLVLAAGIYALYKHQELRKQKLLAEDIFYTMKSMELEFAPIAKMARLSQDAHLIARVKQYQTRRKLMENKYDKFI
jgi:membrane-bound lytic murein transglycosylase D